MDTTKPPHVLTQALFALTLTMPFGCRDPEKEPPTDEEVGYDETGETGEGPEEVCKSSCQECQELMKETYACMAFDEFKTPLSSFSCIVCDNDGPGSAALTCETQANLQSVVYSTMDAQVVACDTATQSECTDWNPSDHVHPIRGNEWDVERELIEALLSDPSPLVGCDSARVEFSRGAYRVTSLDADDLLGLLGLMDGDVIQRIDDYSITGPADVALAFFNLWPNAREVTVSVLRPGAGIVTLTFNVV